MRSIIVGFDPGLTTALAALDLKGRLVGVESRKQFGKEITKEALRFGRPLIIAVDRADASRSAAKLASSFSCLLFEPEHDLSLEEKAEAVKELVKKEFLSEGRPAPSYSAHEKDALAAAIFAWKAYSQSLSKIDDALASQGMQEKGEQVKRMILLKKAKNIAEAVGMLSKGPGMKEPAEREPANINWKARAEEAERKLRAARNSLGIQKIYVEKLEQRLGLLEKQKRQKLEEELKKTEEARRDVMREKDSVLKQSMIAQLGYRLKQEKREREKLSGELEKVRELEQIGMEEAVPVVIVKEFTRNMIDQADRSLGIRDRLVLFEKGGGNERAAKLLIVLQPKAIIAKLPPETEEKLKAAGIPVIAAEGIARLGNYGYIKSKEVERLVKEQERKGFVAWLKAYKKREKAD